MNLLRLLTGSLLGLAFLAPGLRAQNVTQDVGLSDGWNAVWLEVEPRDGNGDLMAPQDVFTDPTITVVVTPKPLAGLAEFFAASPDAGGAIGTFNQSEWQQWKRDDQAGTNNLPVISGNRPYLVKVEPVAPTPPPVPDFNLQVTGAVRFFRPTWTPDRYNLVGFGIEGDISFTDFFAPAAATHPVAKVYTLTGAGNWVPVNPNATTYIEDGEAYWIFCSGTSDFMGPVSVDFNHSITGTLHFGGPSDAVSVDPAPSTVELDLEELVFTNRHNANAVPSLDLITPDPLSGAADFELHVVVPTPNDLTYTTNGQVDTTPNENSPSNLPNPPAALGETIVPQTTGILSLGAKRLWNSAPLGRTSRTNVYRLTTANPGTKVWLPVSANKSDVTPNPDTAPLDPADPVAGLWVGEVIIDAVTSSVEDGSPTRPAAGSAPIRIILHSNNTGDVSLLSQVTVMQTKTADPEVEPIPVLVVSQDRIPFYEGIKERNGKLVGLRIEAVAYDMPRDTSFDAQKRDPNDPDEVNDKDLIDMIVEESTSPVTKWLNGANLYLDRTDVENDDEAIEEYLLFRSIRPPALKEVYALTHLLDGALGAGKTVRTSATAPLVLDPFHRSNPFRHAFHQKHGRGPSISRAIEIVFDPNQGADGRLRGTFRDTFTGVTKSNLELTGRITLERISAVETLD